MYKGGRKSIIFTPGRILIPPIRSGLVETFSYDHNVGFQALALRCYCQTPLTRLTTSVTSDQGVTVRIPKRFPTSPNVGCQPKISFMACTGLGRTLALNCASMHSLPATVR